MDDYFSPLESCIVPSIYESYPVGIKIPGEY